MSSTNAGAENGVVHCGRISSPRKVWRVLEQEPALSKVSESARDESQRGPGEEEQASSPTAPEAKVKSPGGLVEGQNQPAVGLKGPTGKIKESEQAEEKEAGEEDNSRPREDLSTDDRLLEPRTQGLRMRFPRALRAVPLTHIDPCFSDGDSQPSWGTGTGVPQEVPALVCSCMVIQIRPSLSSFTGQS